MTMNEQSSKTETWWTPDGWHQDAAPASYSATEKETDYEKALTLAGYQRWAQYGTEFDQLQISLYRGDRHWLVDISNETGGLGIFFVAQAYESAFFATWYAQFLQDAALVNGYDPLCRIAKTLTAFVRHGHGAETIDEFGHMDKDDKRAALRAKEFRSRQAE
jgi:hypothetical protein